MQNYILVTGGLGFIGSHVVVQLIDNGFDVIIVDNLSNSNKNVFDTLLEITQRKLLLFEIDVRDKSLENVFKKYSILGIIHLAAYKAVNESIHHPLDYYDNNVGGAISLLSLCEKYNVCYFIFSSSATVYGDSPAPLFETSPAGINIGSPYGRTKYFTEQILQDLYPTIKTRIAILRYFNPVGAHVSGKIGENPNGIPNNLMPFLLKVAVKNNLNPLLEDVYSELKIFGNDYPTIDGTAARDYIHVEDLASAHIKCFDYLKSVPFDIFNIGTGQGTTVLQLVNTFAEVNQVTIPYVFCDKRAGDMDIVFCDTTKSKNVLKWEPKHTLETICRDAYRFVSKVSETSRLS